MLPFSHDTRVLVVDDDQLFLDSFEYRYHTVLRCQTEANPLTAIKLLQDNNAAWGHLWQKSKRSVAQYPDAEQQAGRNPLRALVQEPSRADVFGVIIVDYAMPVMSGVELCRALKSVPARKIMLTGQAQDSTAISAFNEGLIDCFLTKQASDLPTKIVHEVTRLREVFFRQQSAVLKAHFELHADVVSREACLKAITSELIRLGSTEHYFWDEPPGILVLGRDGSRYMLVIFSVDDMRAQLEVAEAAGAPLELVERLRLRDCIAWFPTAGGYFDLEYADTWQNFVASAERIEQDGYWLATFVVQDGRLSRAG
jgi:CheY-like chemotaxis protein